MARNDVAPLALALIPPENASGNQARVAAKWA
jgi:hypothetical protein